MFRFDSVVGGEPAMQHFLKTGETSRDADVPSDVNFPYERARRRVLAGWRNRLVSFKAVVYALVGVVNTAVDYTVFLAVHAVFDLSLVAANMLSWMIAISVAYVLHSTITFAAESGRKLRWPAYFIFVASGVAGWLANTATVLVAAEVLLLPVWLAKLLAVMASFIVNFSSSRFIVFRVRPGLAAMPVNVGR